MSAYPPPNSLTRWVVYGRKRATVAGRDVSAGVHAEGLTSHDAAKMFLTRQIMLGGHVDAVIVMLLNGVDKPSERFVITRHNAGRAWWE